MKSFMRILFTASLLLTIFALNTEAKDFRGIITYKITYEGAEIDPQMQAMLPKIMTYYINGNKAKVEIKSSMMNNSHIIDADDKVVYDLYDMMGQKFYTKQTSEEIEEEMAKQSDPELKFVDETKEIAGYECKKVVVTFEQNGKTHTFNAYYAPELGTKALNFSNPLFKDVNGALMEFEMNEGPMTMRFSAISVEKKRIKGSEFKIPEDYKETTKEELRQNMGGGM